MRIGVGLSIPELATRGGRFSPASLFTSGVAGAWYDPSDYSTLFQDSAGTTPVTAVEQPVGLMLDKSQGLVLGSEATSGAWLNGYTTTFDTFTSTGPSSFTATTTGAKSPRVAVLANLPAAGWYWIEFTATFTGGSFTTSGFSNTGSPYSAAVATTVLPATGVAFRTLIYTSAAREYLTLTFIASGASTLSVSGVSVKSYAGNHASQATPTSCPVLRARYNYLTYSEDFSNAAWSKTGITVGAAVTPPSGTSAAYEITSSATSIMRQTPTVLASNHIAQIYAKKKPGATDWVLLQVSESGLARKFWFNVGNGTIGTKTGTGTHSINDAGNGWYRCSVAFATSAGICLFDIEPVTADGGSTGDSAYIGGTDLRLASTSASAPTYQRIAAATDYATAGFLPYLYFVTDDSFGTNSINFTSTDKMSVCAGVTKLSDAAIGVLVELSANSSSNLGTFGVFAPGSVAAEYTFQCSGSSLAARRATTYTSPTTNVLFVAFDNAQSTTDTEIVPRINGATPTLTNIIGPAGTGNFTNTALYIGRRNNATLPFNGNFYQLIVCGKTLSASELASTEAYVNARTGAY